MRFIAQNGHVDIANLDAGAVVLWATEQVGEARDIDLAVVSMTVNHARALAAGLNAACDELDARAVDL